MNEELERLERALRAAHAAGDRAAASQFAAEIRAIRTREAVMPNGRPAIAAGMADRERNNSAPITPRPAQPARVSPTPTPAPTTARERGAAAALAQPEQLRRLQAETQGMGSAWFGAGTPLTAAAKFVAAALPGGREPIRPGEALEEARGHREALQEEHPVAFTGGVAKGMVLGAGPARVAAEAVTRLLPRVAQTVFTLQSGQTAKNIARLAATGAASAGVTAAAEQGMEAVPGEAALGAVAAPAVVGGVKAAAAGVGSIAARVDPNSAAIRILARRIGEPVQALADRYNRFIETMGRPPRLVEIVQRETAEELGQISRARSTAGQVFREAEEQAALERPIELPVQLRGGRTTTSETAQRSLLTPIREETSDVLRSRARSTEAAELGQRNVNMDRLMNRIGQHAVPLNPNMLSLLESPDVSTALSPILRRKVNRAIELGEEMGTVTLTVREWDQIRQDLAKRSGPGSGKDYSNLRNQIRDYVGAVVPEYSAGLEQFGLHTDYATGVSMGRKALSQDTQEFIDSLQTSGGGTALEPQRPNTQSATIAGARLGARAALVNLLSGTPRQIENGMLRIARDGKLRANLRQVLSAQELEQLERLGERYGRRLDIAEGVKLGRKVTSPSDSENFRQAVAEAASTPAGRAGVAAGARTAVVDAAGESPARAAQMAVDLVENPEFRSRLTAALGPLETNRMVEVGRTTTEAGRRLSAAAPQGTQAQAKAREDAQAIQGVIQSVVIATNRFSGAFLANMANNIVQRTRLSKKAATRLAELAVDPNMAETVIRKLRSAGYDADAVLRMYQGAAVAAGIFTGRE